MAISLYCRKCNKVSKLGTKTCQCGTSLKAKARYRVRFKMSTGKWKSQVVDTLTPAETVEAKYRIDSVTENVLEIHINIIHHFQKVE